MVSDFKHAFVESRKILDAVLIANEATNSKLFFFMNKSTNSKLKSFTIRVICKLDIKKAYDSINWGYLIGIHGKKGFR